MATIQRGSKSAGGTEFSTGPVLAAEVNTDLNTLYNEVNGSLDNANIKGTAGIAETKIDDISSTATAAASVAFPGSAESPSLATTLSGEIQRLRYAIGRMALGGGGTSIKHYDGAEKSVPWFEEVLRGPNQVRNSSFEAQSGGAGTAPDGWALVGTPSTLSLATSTVGAGSGRSARIVTDASGEGISQTFAGLKASTLYLLTVEASVASGTLSVTTTGAMTTGSYRNAARTSTTTARHWMGVLLKTDATPTNLVLSLTGVSSGADFTLDTVGLYEVRTDVMTPPGYLAVSDSSNATTGTLDTTRRGFPDGDALSVSLSVPGPGYSIRVTANCCFTDNVANTMVAVLVENDGSATDATSAHSAIGANEGGSVNLHYVNTSPTPGATYTYTIEALLRTGAGTNNGTIGGVTAVSRLTAELIPPG